MISQLTLTLTDSPVVGHGSHKPTYNITYKPGNFKHLTHAILYSSSQNDAMHGCS